MDNLYLEPDGFLGTGASLLADLTLVAYLFIIIPAMLAGFVFARRNMHRPQHKWTMIAITVINWVLIVLLMARALFFDVTDNLADQPGNGRYLFPALHAILGLSAQFIATSLVYRMLREDTQVAAAKRRGETQFSKYWARNVKTPMRLTLALWLATSMLGILSYVTRYDVIPTFGEGKTAPVATEEPSNATQEPGETPEPNVTPEVNVTAEPATQEPGETLEPNVTPEVNATAEP